MLPKMFAVLGAVVAVTCSVGCNSSEQANYPKTYPVSGIVTHKGSPVEGATVMFMGSGQDSKGAVGRTDASGRYELTTFVPGDGALPGSYQIVVTKIQVSETEEDVTASGSGDREPTSSPAKDLLPAKFKNPNASGLSAAVSETAENVVNLDLGN